MVILICHELHVERQKLKPGLLVYLGSCFIMSLMIKNLDDSYYLYGKVY